MSRVRRFKELSWKNSNRTTSGENELNRGFALALRRNFINRGGGGPASEEQYPVDGPVEFYLTAFKGDDPETTDELNTTTVTLDEGDCATISVGKERYRVKLYGLFMYRPEADNILNSQRVAVSIDRWVEHQEVWNEKEFRVEFEESLNWEDRGNTVRLSVANALGYNPEKDFLDLVDEGLSPAEALDYWMAEVRNHSQTEWADKRGKSQQAVSKNVRKARRKLGKNDKTDLFPEYGEEQ